jgi:hypothetical protein
MKCPSCKSEIGSLDKRCMKCGVSLVLSAGRSGDVDGADVVPSYHISEEKERREHFIANVAISIVVAIVFLLFAGCVGFRYFGLGLPKDLNKSINVQLNEFNVVDVDGVSDTPMRPIKNFVVHYSVVNKSGRDLKRLTLQIGLKSDQLQLSAMGENAELVSVINSGEIFKDGEVRVIGITRPVLADPIGLVKLTWTSDVVEME